MCGNGWALHQERGGTANHATYFWILDIGHNNLNISPHQLYVCTECNQSVWFVCVYKIDVSSQGFFSPRCVCVESNFQIFQQPKTQHVYNLLLIKTSGNLNVLSSCKAFSLSQSCIYQWDKHPVQYQRSYKGMSAVHWFTVQVLLCWSFLQFRRFLTDLCNVSFPKHFWHSI